MSTMDTPTRNSRGIAMQPLKTKTTVMTCGWLTPPQSAHESRRPSIQSFASSISPFSQPSTPVHISGADERSTWTPSPYGLDTSTSTPLTKGLSHAVIEQHALCGGQAAAGISLYTPTTPNTSFEAYDVPSDLGQGCQDVWTESYLSLAGYNGYDSALRPMGFESVHHFTTDPMALSQYDHLGLPGATQSPATTLIAAQNGDRSPHAVYAPHQIVVPSQLGAVEDNGAHQYSIHSTPNYSQSLSSTFSSINLDLASYEHVTQPTSEADYVGFSDGEEYTMIRHGGFCTRHLSDRSKSRASVGKAMSVRSKKRASDRLRNRGTQTIRLPAGSGIDFRAEGEEAIKALREGLTADGKFKKIQSDIDIRKPNVCKELNPDGTKCGERFKRSEHLNRHMGKHIAARPWPCPWSDCATKGSRFSRSDNACDHYKTHLKRKKGGERNKRCEWPDLKRLLQFVLTEKQMDTVTRNVEKWILDPKKQEEHEQSRHLAPFAY